MLIKKYQCNKCGTMMDDSYYVWFGRQDIGGSNLDSEDEIYDAVGDRLGDVHFCKACTLKVIQTLNIELETEDKMDPIDDECGLPFTTPEEPKKPKKERAEMLSKEELEILIYSKPIVDIATQCGCTDKTIRNWCAKYGIKIPRHYRKKDC